MNKDKIAGFMLGVSVGVGIGYFLKPGHDLAHSRGSELVEQQKHPSSGQESGISNATGAFERYLPKGRQRGTG
jgi:hypothetical protein